MPRDNYRDKPSARERSILADQAQLVATMGLRGYTDREIHIVARAVLLARLAPLPPREPAQLEPEPEWGWHDGAWTRGDWIED